MYVRDVIKNFGDLVSAILATAFSTTLNVSDAVEHFAITAAVTISTTTQG
jgi:hypothetical protein